MAGREQFFSSGVARWFLPISFLAITLPSWARAGGIGEIYSVKDHGATGNGSTDDAPAIRAAIAAASAAGGGTVFLPPGQYVIKSTLVLDGAVSMVGDRSARILFDAGGTYDGTALNPVVIHFGRSAVWTGKFSGVNMRQVGTFSRLYGLILRSARDFEISGCVFDNIMATDGGSFLTVQFGEHQPGSTPFGDVKRGRILNNSILFRNDNAAMEASSTGGNTEDVLYQGNIFIDMGDDAYAAHGSRKIRFIGNHIETKVGRILLDSSSDCVIANNVFVKRNSSGGSAGIVLAMAYDGAPYVANSVVANNLIMNEDASHDLVFPIDVRGVDAAVIANNVLVNKRGAGLFRLRLTPAQFGQTSYFNKRVTISGNTVHGGGFDLNNSFAGGGTGGPIAVFGNIADGGGFTSSPMKSFLTPARKEIGADNFGFAASTGSPTRDGGDGYLNGQTLGAFSATSITTGADLALAGTSLTYLWNGSPTRLTRIRVSFSAPIPSPGVLHILSSPDAAADTLLATATIPKASTHADLFFVDGGRYMSEITVPAHRALKLRLTSANLGGVSAYATLVGEPSPY